MVYGDGKMCRVAPLVLSLMQLFSSIAEFVTSGILKTSPHDIIYFGSINMLFLLSPILVLLLVRNICFVVGLLAMPIAAIFLARIHYTLIFLKFGSAALNPKGDWAIWLNSLIGASSVIIVAAAVFTRVVLFGFDLADRAIAISRKVKE